MSIDDAKQLDRTAQFLITEVKRAYGSSPPTYDNDWQIVWDAKVDRIELNPGPRPSVARLWFPSLRWHQSHDLKWCDRVRIRTAEPAAEDRTIIYSGFVVSYLSSFSGGTDKGGSFERCSVVCKDHRWLLSVSQPLYGILARGPDDYVNYGTPSQAPKQATSYTFLSGRRAVFNEHGRANRDPDLLDVQDTDADSTHLCDTPIFSAPYLAVDWTARQMIEYILSPANNPIYDIMPISNPAAMIGLDHPDLAATPSSVDIDRLSPLAAIDKVAKSVGMSFREAYDPDGNATLIFYKPGSASGYSRSATEPVILHTLHAPAEGEAISSAVSQGKYMLWSMDLAEDITSVINAPLGLAPPDRFEITAELVPAWLDSDFDPDTSESNANLYFYEADLQEMTDPNSKDYYKYYHPRGSSFARDVGRRWALNESGRYTGGSYDRGVPFDFSAGANPAIDPEYILEQDSAGRQYRRYAPFDRQLLDPLTLQAGSLNPVPIKVEFSFDGGTTWQVIPAAISSLSAEAGLYIDEPNLAELSDQAQATISGGDLDDVPLNFFTSLADDKVNSRSYKLGQWKTRVRVTASIQMDQRLARQAAPSANSGSAFDQAACYNLTDKYGLMARCQSSVYHGSGLYAWNTNPAAKFDNHLAALRDANEDMSICGSFTLERLWLGDGAGAMPFQLGDSISSITGRNYDLSASFGQAKVYPEICQIIFLPETQKTQLITRDLRFAQVT